MIIRKALGTMGAEKVLKTNRRTKLRIKSMKFIHICKRFALIKTGDLEGSNPPFPLERKVGQSSF